MGEVRVIAPAKAQLKEWWSSLREDGRGVVRFHIGRMLPLIDIRLRFGLFHALTHFWSPETTTLIFGTHELTPTLEEYSVLLGKSLDSGLVSPPIGQDPVLVLSEYLGFNRNDVARVLKANRGSCPIPFLDLCFEQAPSALEQAKIFILLFFGSLIFPHKRNAIDPLIASLAQQVYDGKNCINAILAETFISLSKLNSGQDKTFRVSPEIFQIWFLSHFSKFGNFLKIPNINEHEHPLLKFEHEQDQIPDHHYSRWLVLLTNPSPVTFLWRAPWFRVKEARIAGWDGTPVPLLGFSGITGYYPDRVVRQYGVIQSVPSKPKTDNVRVDFVMGKRMFEDHVSLALSMWQRCRPTKLVLPEETLLGMVKTYHASIRYIRGHFIPKEWLPVIPQAPARDTKQVEINRLKRELAKAKEKTKEIGDKYKKLKTRADSQKFIARAK